MKTYYRLADIPPAAGQGAGTAVALGFFDGVHTGHRAVIDAAVDWAGRSGLAPAAFSFTLPAGHAMKGGRLITEDEKRERIAALGVKEFFEPEFSEFCDLSPEQFVGDMLAGRFGARAVFCGGNFTFGKKAAGKVQDLKDLCAPLGIRVQVVPMALYEGETVSSTRIRAALAAGDIPAVNAMLGRPYAIDFAVRHGKGLGRTLGMPTINQVFPEGFAQPGYGVYATRVWLDGAPHAGATGFGVRPTVDPSGQNPTCETFIPGFEGEVYGRRVRVEFLRRIGDSRRFDTAAGLRAAVMGWAADAAAVYAEKEGQKPL